MKDYIDSLYNVCKKVNEMASKNNDNRLKLISLLIYNYTRHMAKTHNINLREITESTNNINLIPIFKYMTTHNIELYNFNNIDINDVDTSKKEDLERFVLSHIYYITQHM